MTLTLSSSELSTNTGVVIPFVKALEVPEETGGKGARGGVFACDDRLKAQTAAHKTAAKKWNATFTKNKSFKGQSANRLGHRHKGRAHDRGAGFSAQGLDLRRGEALHAWLD
ncbi:hypothetical protein AwPolaro_02900 [Polaromonas sp.]|nr:hypothetical protein AwPolaro_02900 [Polaromonas sp.]